MIETVRCSLFNIQENDYEDIKKLYVDENVRQFLGGIVDDQIYNIKFIEMYKSKEGALYLVARKKDDKQFLGLISLDLYHDGESTEISYQFVPKYWGYGYATEIVQEVINYAFNGLGLEKVVAETQTKNRASVELLKRIGMNFDKTVERFGVEQSVFSIINTKEIRSGIASIKNVF